jgi:small nuclear ribonucleoprotein (snRNP)-like protein
MNSIFIKQFRDLADKKAVVRCELKNNVTIEGQLNYIDENFNMNLISVKTDFVKYPQFVNKQHFFNITHSIFPIIV